MDILAFLRPQIKALEIWEEQKHLISDLTKTYGTTGRSLLCCSSRPWQKHRELQKRVWSPAAETFDKATPCLPRILLKWTHFHWLFAADPRLNEISLLSCLCRDLRWKFENTCAWCLWWLAGFGCRPDFVPSSTCCNLILSVMCGDPLSWEGGQIFEEEVVDSPSSHSQESDCGMFVEHLDSKQCAGVAILFEKIAHSFNHPHKTWWVVPHLTRRWLRQCATVGWPATLPELFGSFHSTTSGHPVASLSEAFAIAWPC